MQPDINQKRAFVQQEFARRAGGQMPSSSGMGAAVTNQPGAANPIPPSMQTNPQIPSGGAAGTPSDGTISGMKSQKGEATKLSEAMVWRMKKLTERGE